MGPLPLRHCTFIFSAQNTLLLFPTAPARPLGSGSLPREAGTHSPRREAGSHSSRRASVPLPARLAVRAADAHRPLLVRRGIAGGREGFPVSGALRTAPAALRTLQRRGLKAQIRPHYLETLTPPPPPPPASQLHASLGDLSGRLHRRVVLARMRR
ncbi:unnamed protein product [Rangifer tarandus platyrhynchus]|uniref:Uncharacterized protein n=2 Tax=Rangifer tarandus platyrhynchus TaxID=3082113 RepID=A0ABN8ZLU6_RANTA|nr:unnamed protein product [Rangifer tarandus platyrhynchus]CAI9708256.1 unnamed protein product [Rangifer tarandus platyrhynchus]